MQKTTDLYAAYLDITQKAADVQYASAVLEWDQEVYMPTKGFAHRGRQLATLASQAHDMLTGTKYGDILTELFQRTDLTPQQQANVKLSREDYEKNRKLPSTFIEAITRQTSQSFNTWIQARNENNYRTYAPELKKMIALKRQQADYYGYKQHPYDALLNDYEKGATVSMLDPVFAMVREHLPPLLKKISEAQQVDNQFFHRQFPKDRQWAFSIDVLKGMGYDLEAGRQDYAEHPFTTSFSSKDVRITTRVDEHNFSSLLWSSIHEGGHALYEQGLPETEYGLPLGSAASLAIHESQSRLWENCVGRGTYFWKHYYPILQSYFPMQLADVSEATFYKGMNRVSPSLIRTEADEVTYHFHVMIRYEIEKALIIGDLDPNDISDAWNHMYQQYLGVHPADDKTGVLQDVHWCHGSFGYFPTYSLGSFYAAQLMEEATKQLPVLYIDMARGDYTQLLQWLRTQVHQYGRMYTSEELCKKITGCGLDFTSFMRYIETKYKNIYNLH
jgi:carboxypeptidase Taq